MYEPTILQFIIFYIICCFIGIPSWIVLIQALSALDSTKMKEGDWLTAIFFGLVPLIQVIPFGIFLIIECFIILPTKFFNLIFRGKFTIE